VTLAEQLQPDVILMDIYMPGISGIDAMRQIHEPAHSHPDGHDVAGRRLGVRSNAGGSAQLRAGGTVKQRLRRY
jgi:CheY-like chemotaxis protein